MNSFSRPNENKHSLSGGWQPDHETMLRQAAERAMDFRRGLDDRPQRPGKTFTEIIEQHVKRAPAYIRVRTLQ